MAEIKTPAASTTTANAETAEAQILVNEALAYMLFALHEHIVDTSFAMPQPAKKESMVNRSAITDWQAARAKRNEFRNMARWVTANAEILGIRIRSADKSQLENVTAEISTIPPSC